MNVFNATMQDVSEERMREIASEMNLSETAFILLQNPNDSYNISFTSFIEQTQTHKQTNKQTNK